MPEIVVRNHVTMLSNEHMYIQRAGWTRGMRPPIWIIQAVGKTHTHTLTSESQASSRIKSTSWRWQDKTPQSLAAPDPLPVMPINH